MTQKSELGQLGEDIACEYLVDKGYKIIGRNIRKPWGELDIVAKYKDGALVFVEVKTLRCYSGQAIDQQLQPEDQLTKAKLYKLQKTASLYAGHYPGRVDSKKGWRIDLVAIIISRENCEIKHYENIAL